MRELLIICLESSGGLADYAHFQAEALAGLGISVMLLAPADFQHQSPLYQLAAALPPSRAVVSRRFIQRLRFAAHLLLAAWLSDSAIRKGSHRSVLFTSYSEYLAPLWAWRFRRWRRKGVRFAAVVHDPVRNFQVGPRWWHRLSISEGYSFLDHAFVHAPILLDTVRLMPAMKVSVIPHGSFPFPPSPLTREQARSNLGIPEDVPLLLSFGRLRSDKNLDRLLQALATHPTTHLLIAGPEATPGQLQSADYQALARENGVAERCHWRIHFHEPEQVSPLFQAADAVALAYSASFRSASGVLNVVASFGLPVLASAGDGALRMAVQRYRLGVLVSPDDTEALAAGLDRLLSTPAAPDWQGYLQANSWSENARLVVEAMGLRSADG